MASASPAVASEADLEALASAIRNYGGKLEPVADLAAVAAYAQKLARTRSSKPRVVIEPGALDEAAWAAATDVTVRKLEPLPDGAALRQDIIDTDVGVGLVDHAIADTGQAVLYSSGEWGRMLAFLSPIYVGVVRRGRIVPTLLELLSGFDGDRLSREAPSMTFVSGCSVSADIENIVTAGVHGPLELHLLVLP